MDIDKLKKKRQLNVQEQNALGRNDMKQCALAYRQANKFRIWVRFALQSGGLNPDDGVLLFSTTVPCGGNKEYVRAYWLTSDKRFYEIEATTVLGSLMFVSLDSLEDVTDRTTIDPHLRGKGKSFGCLAIEVLEDLSGGLR